MNPMPAAANSSFVTLRAGGENFAIEVCFVREILEYSPITPLPQAPPFLLGVINVRGCTVPVVDLCIKLGLPTVPVSVDTRILVLEITVAGPQLVVGLLVDKVFEVAEFEAEQPGSRTGRGGTMELRVHSRHQLPARRFCRHLRHGTPFRQRRHGKPSSGVMNGSISANSFGVVDPPVNSCHCKQFASLSIR